MVSIMRILFVLMRLTAQKKIEKMGLQPDLVIVDPPRKGCQKELFDVIETMGAKRMIYVSCDSATLAGSCHFKGKRLCSQKILSL